MPTTYLDAIGELQQRNIAALKAVQSAHIATLTAARDISARIGPAVPITNDAAQIGIAFAFRLMAEQAAIAQRFVAALAPSAVPQKPTFAIGTPEIVVEASASTTSPPAEPQTMTESAVPSILVAPFFTDRNEFVANLVSSTSPNIIEDPASVPVLETGAVSADPSATIISADIDETPMATTVPSVSSYRMPPKSKRSNKPKSSR